MRSIWLWYITFINNSMPSYFLLQSYFAIILWFCYRNWNNFRYILILIILFIVQDLDIYVNVLKTLYLFLNIYENILIPCIVLDWYEIDVLNEKTFCIWLFNVKRTHIRLQVQAWTNIFLNVLRRVRLEL